MEFKLRPVEKFIFYTFNKKTAFWVRYANVVFILWDHGHLALDNFLLNVNNLDRNIKFSLEIEKDACLPFLDVHLDHNDQMLSSTVYRKPMKKMLLFPSMLICFFITRLQPLNLLYSEFYLFWHTIKTRA